MSIEQLTWGFDVTCDYCGETQFFDISEHHFPTLLAEMKEYGWKSRKDQDDEWEHFCPSCQDREKESHEA